jgi:hypothetical protein
MTGSQRDLSLVSWTLYKVLITVSVFSFSSLFLISGGGPWWPGMAHVIPTSGQKN